MNKQITVVFLMGGKAQRFGGKFKPFLKLYDRTFLEHAIQPFLKHASQIKEIIFLTTEEQAYAFQVQAKIKSFNLPVSWMIYSTATADGIIADINKLIGDRSGLNDVIFCDCDHSLNVDDIFEAIQNHNYNIILPVWPLRDDVNKWSVVHVDDNGLVDAIAEKKYPTGFSSNHHGVIGCYYFKFYTPHYAVTRTPKYLSDVISDYLEENKVAKIVHIKEAEFFGDPERLNNLYAEKKASTIFCDLDGTILKHENEPVFTQITLLEGAKDKIQQWRDDNCFIVLTTSRDEQFRPEMEKLLREAGIRYEAMVMNLPPGPRHLINDRKPYSNHPMAKAHEVVRDHGIKDIQIGHSFAEYSQGGDISYKTLPQGASEYQQTKFRAQYDSMNALYHNPQFKDLVPPMYAFENNSYGMQTLKGYKGLHMLFAKEAPLKKLFEGLTKLYVAKRPAYGWLEGYLNEKIYAKKEALEALGLDATEVFTRLKALTIQEIELLSPQSLCDHLHGDLTYENILVKGEDVKLIDFDNDNKNGAPEQDLGKLFQSAYAQYEHWDSGIAYQPDVEECAIIVRFYAEVFSQPKEQVYKKAMFYCSLHLFRMIIYQANRDMKRAEKALELCKEMLKLV